MKDKGRGKREERREKREKREEREERREKREERGERREERREKRREENFFKKVSRPSNPPDELAQNVSKKNPFRTNYSSIFSAKVQNLAVFHLFT